jgi:hypothetical protein
MGKHGLTKLTMARTWGNHHLPLYSIICAWPWSQHPNVILPRDSQVGNPKILNWDSRNLEAHNFVCKPLIEVMFKAKL